MESRRDDELIREVEDIRARLLALSNDPRGDLSRDRIAADLAVLLRDLEVNRLPVVDPRSPS